MEIITSVKGPFYIAMIVDQHTHVVAAGYSELSYGQAILWARRRYEDVKEHGELPDHRRPSPYEDMLDSYDQVEDKRRFYGWL